MFITYTAWITLYQNRCIAVRYRLCSLISRLRLKSPYLALNSLPRLFPLFFFQKSSNYFKPYLLNFHLCKFLAESSALRRALGDEVFAIDENEVWLSIVLNDDFILNDWNIIGMNAECQTVSRYLLPYKTETNVILIYKPDHLPAKYIMSYIFM